MFSLICSALFSLLLLCNREQLRQLSLTIDHFSFFVCVYIVHLFITTMLVVSAGAAQGVRISLKVLVERMGP